MRIQMKTTTVTMMIGVIGEMIGVIGEVRGVREMGKKGEAEEAEEAASTTTVATVGRWEGGVKGAKEVSASQTCLEMAATVLRLLLRLLARGVVAMAAKTGAEVVLITVITVMA